MSRNRFQEIKTYLHLADNLDIEKGNIVAKVQPLYNMVNEKLKQFGIFHEHLSIDESMVPYRGRHGCKMYIKAKPIRFGFKLWSLCSSNGYPYHMNIYTGKSADSTEPLGSKVVNGFIDIVRQNSDVTKHYFFDNFFTSYDLILKLSGQNVKVIRDYS